MKHLESARDKVLMGPERKARLPDEEANLITAYHEGGHAIVAYYTKVIEFISIFRTLIINTLFYLNRNRIHCIRLR